jgi:hypothetical protein
MASIATTIGTYFSPYASRIGDKTAKTVEYLCANTAGGAADADHTLTAFALSGTADFVIDYMMANVIIATTTARYTMLFAGETVTSFTKGGGESIMEIVDFGDFGGVRITGQTSTAPIVQFVSSNAAATAGSKIITVIGHWA